MVRATNPGNAAAGCPEGGTAIASPGTARIRARVAAHVAVWVVAGATLAACSHTSTYIRDPLVPSTPPVPAADSILQRVILIGDAGAPSVDGEPVLMALRDTANHIPSRTVVVYLGDNIYPAGLPALGAYGRDNAERALDAQIAAVGDARAIFIPGNHDWDDGDENGLLAIRRMAVWLNRYANADLSPIAGCPGPGIHELPAVRLVTLDTQWWLHGHDRGGTCAQSDTAGVTAALRSALVTDDGRPVIVAGHHPLETRGPHGGFFTFGEWIFPAHMATGNWRWLIVPLPGLGPLIRWFVRTDQDFVSSGNTDMRRQLEAALRTRPPLLYAAGHDHSLQIFDGEDVASVVLVSGLGSSEKATSVGSDAQTLFADQHSGFMVLDILRDRALLRVVEPRDDPVVYWTELDIRGSSGR